MNPPSQLHTSPKSDAVWQELMLRLPPDVSGSRMMGMPDGEFRAYQGQLRECQKLMRKLQAC
jgi:hypothetical protein